MIPAHELCTFAGTLLGSAYVLGALAPKNLRGYRGPFDCAEYASYVVYQTAGQLYGCAPGATDPAKANAFTGFWYDQSKREGHQCTVEQALYTEGAFLLRAPGAGGTGGHIALSTGKGTTYEAHSSDKGVILLGGAAQRRWTCGVLVPFYTFAPAQYPARLLRLTKPRLRGEDVARVQRIVGVGADGVFGPETEKAVVRWQAAHGLVADGEVGTETWAAMAGR